MQLDESHLSSSSVGKSYDVTDFADPPPIQPQVRLYVELQFKGTLSNHLVKAPSIVIKIAKSSV